MAGQRQPIELVQAKGAKHLTRAEIEERKNREIKPITDGIAAPEYLTKKQKQTFDRLADQLKKLKIMGETDVDALARYVTANDLYITAVRKMRSTEVKKDPVLLEAWSKLQERYFKQCRTSANDLGLSISSRCRLVVPEAKGEAPKENKFKKFEKRSASGE